MIWFLFLFLLLPTSALATVTNLADCTQGVFSTAYTAAAVGDTLAFPSCGTIDAPISWTTGITNSKGIKITGAGAGPVIGISEPSQTIGTGAKTFTLGSADAGVAVTGAGLAITPGQTLRIQQTASGSNWMQGTVTSYSGSTLVMDITTTGGSGTSTRWLITTLCSTCLQHNVASAGTMFQLTEHTTARAEFSGVFIKDGSGTGPKVKMSRVTNGLAMLVHDNRFTNYGTESEAILTDTCRGVIWNNSFDSKSFTGFSAFTQKFCSSTSWSTVSTMGTADTDGLQNLYLEDNNFHGYLNACDFDDFSRVVVRNSIFNNAGCGSHGADTSQYGNRHFEYYDNAFIYDRYSNGTSFNMGGRQLYVRGGTFVHTGNKIYIGSGNDYPAPAIDMQVLILRRAGGYSFNCWGAPIVVSAGENYPAPRQVGFGWIDGSGGMGDYSTPNGESEPAYIWGNTGTTVGIATSDNAPECTAPMDTSAVYIQAGRDYFNNGTAKPGWERYPYPHWLRGAAPPATNGVWGRWK